MRKWQGYIDCAFANDIPLVDLMEKAYQMGRTDAKVEYENADIPIIHGKEELELHDSRIRADERAKVIEEVMTIVKAKISEKEYPIETMVELTDLGARIQKLKEQKADCIEFPSKYISEMLGK